MPTFTVKVRHVDGTASTTAIEAETRDAVVRALREKNYFPISIEEAGTGFQSEIKIPGFGGKVKLKDVAVSARQLATMIGAGLPLLRALTILTEQTEVKALAKVWGACRLDVETGSSFSASLAKHPKVFNELFVSMVKAGEAGGVLDDVLLRIADTLEAQVALRNKVKSAMTYPVMVGILVFIILTAILLFVVPTFESLYKDLGGTLPLPTRILLVLSKIMKKFFPLVIAGFFVLGILFRRYIKTDAGRKQFDYVKLKLPVFGPLFQKIAMTRFARTFGVLLDSGVPVLQCLEITKDTVQNRIVGDALIEVQTAVREGEPIARPLERHAVFPPMVVQMLAVGEETGAIGQMLEKVADFYDSEVTATVEALTSLIEPLLIAVLGGVVGGILISLYLPMFRIINLIK